MRKNVFAKLCAAALCGLMTASLVPAENVWAAADGKGKTVLRVCNWEEYIDLGDWDEEETIDLESGDIIGENSMVEDFEEWYYETYGKEVVVE